MWSFQKASSRACCRRRGSSIRCDSAHPSCWATAPKVKELALELDNISLEGIRVINPAESEDLDNFAHRFEMLRRSKGMKSSEAREAMMQPNYYGAMMVAMHQVDGLISGTSHITGSVLRPLFQIIKVAPKAKTASSCMIMEVEDSRIGENGVLFMADCGVIPEPTVDQLADIAISTAQLARLLMSTRPRRGATVILHQRQCVIASIHRARESGYGTRTTESGGTIFGRRF